MWKAIDQHRPAELSATLEMFPALCNTEATCHLWPLNTSRDKSNEELISSFHFSDFKFQQPRAPGAYTRQHRSAQPQTSGPVWSAQKLWPVSNNRRGSVPGQPPGPGSTHVVALPCPSCSAPTSMSSTHRRLCVIWLCLPPSAQRFPWRTL